VTTPRDYFPPADRRDWKPGSGQRIERLYAWVATEPDGGEGIVSGRFGDMLMPLIGADGARIESFRSLAESVSAATGYPVHLVEFCGRLNHAPLK
jgi:hypothetical protein